MANFKVKLTGQIVKEYLGIIIGTVISSIGLSALLVPNQIAAGGVNGVATILYYLFKLPVGVAILALNIPLFYFQYKRCGRLVTWRTMFCIMIYSPLADIFAKVLEPWTADPLLACLYGGVLLGIGNGIVFNCRGTTGGNAILGQLLNDKLGLSVGRTMMLVDAIIIGTAGLLFGVETALYAFISVFVSSKVVDIVQEGLSYNKSVLIFCDKPEEIGRKIIENVERGVTVFPCRGLYTGGQREALLCIVSQGQISYLRKLVYDYDPKAFLVISSCSEVLGQGFTRLQDKVAKH